MYYQCWNVDECQKGLPNRDKIPSEDLRAGSSINTTQEWGFSRDRMSTIELTIKQTKYKVQ